mmetsp:Transcript_19749/g.45978  ORF Transcript_19749/g.45978 Transcript_19749/m.45978 type:complete len:128 (-) Transcript_19749:1328-1711(-)
MELLFGINFSLQRCVIPTIASSTTLGYKPKSNLMLVLTLWKIVLMLSCLLQTRMKMMMKEIKKRTKLYTRFGKRPKVLSRRCFQGFDTCFKWRTIDENELFGFSYSIQHRIIAPYIKCATTTRMIGL